MEDGAHSDTEDGAHSDMEDRATEFIENIHCAKQFSIHLVCVYLVILHNDLVK